MHLIFFFTLKRKEEKKNRKIENTLNNSSFLFLFLSNLIIYCNGHISCFCQGELFVRSCIPGALDSEYNPGGKPINLCEGCAAGGYRKCQRNAEEQYYGASGAFRCLVESEYLLILGF